MAERILSGKIKQLVYTTEELSQSPLSTTVIDNGVLVYEKTSSGQIKCKMGDGNNVWSELEYIEDSDKMKKNNPTGTGSLSMNRAEGNTIGINSVALGYDCTASGSYSYAEGYNCTTSGSYSHAEGYMSKTSGGGAHSEGCNTNANYDGSHSEGSYTKANNYDAHAEGSYTVASGKRSHAEGYYTIASSNFQHVQGKYNIEDTSSTYAHIVGGGTSNDDRKNIHTLDWNGNAVFSGDVTATKSDGTEVSLLSLKSTLDSIQVQNFYTGIEAPSNTLGEDGDLYLIT